MAGILDAFAGPGGWEAGAHILGGLGEILGVELDAQACNTAMAAGHTREQANIRTLDPADFDGVTGFICSSPCPTLSTAGKRAGLGNAYQAALDAITCVGADCDCSWPETEAALAESADPITALTVQTIRFALGIPSLQWVAFEQVPAAEYLFEDIAAELMSSDEETDHGPGWEAADVFTLDASQLGVPVRRRRTFLVARRYQPLGASNAAHPRFVRAGHDHGFPSTPTMAEALGWPTGHRVRTRGNRKATGGNCFRADGPAWCLTEKARSWQRDADNLKLSPAEAGLLQGFPVDYPWQGSRTRQFHQIGDVVLPPVAAAVLGYVTGTPWLDPLAQYLTQLYGTQHISAYPTPDVSTASRAEKPEQLTLFPTAA